MYVEYRSLLLYVAGRKFRVPDEDCEPLVQEALLSFLTTGTKIDNPRAWLVAAVCNASRHYWRDRARISAVEAERVDDGFDVPREAELEVLERRILIRSLLDRLGSRQREVLRLHYFEGKTAAEVGAALGTTARYATKLITKALATMRTLYERQVPLRATLPTAAEPADAAPAPEPRTASSVRVVRPRRQIVAPARTRVQWYLRKHGISDATILTYSGMRPTLLDDVLSGACVGFAPRARVLIAVRRITGRQVLMEELFDARPDDDAA